MSNATAFTEHHIPMAQGSLHTRDHAGTEPAFVMMHGFPDNLHIYDKLVPLLVAAGRRVVTFDFLGFGQSDKPDGARYDFAQQRADLQAVVDHLRLDRIVPVSHDAAGPAALNFALAHPDRVSGVVVLNSAYAEMPAALWPELITLYATPVLRDYAMALIRSPAQFRWLIEFQRDRFRQALPERHRATYDGFLNPVIDSNFAGGAGDAFVQMTADFFAELRRNRENLSRLAGLDVPVTIIWGEADPYLGLPLAREFHTQFTNASLHTLPGGHWVQVDEPDAVAGLMLGRL